MPTIVRTQKHFTATAGQPLYQTIEKVEALNMGNGQALGSQPASRRFEAAETVREGPPPRRASRSTDLDKTPPAEKKVLPWVASVETGTIPEGMFGPYDSVPPTRMPTMHETIPAPRHRPSNPFASHRPTVHPFAAMADPPTPDQAVPPLPSIDYGGQHGRDSDVLSRGAGLRSMYHGVVNPDDHLPSRNDSGSPGDGTFGMDNKKQTPKKAATGRAPSPTKAHVDHPHSVEGTPKKAATATSRKPVPLSFEPAPAATEKPHIHHPHHDFPFSHAEAAEKQAAAMAHAETLAQLEAQRQSLQAQAVNPAHKGPRGTYQTDTSFGHILHDGQHPISARQSFQPGFSSINEIGSVPMVRDHPQAEQPGMRIPFGVPHFVNLARPFMPLRTGTGIGMAIGIGHVGMGMRGSGLDRVTEHSEGRERQDAKSAYLETVEDEQEPKTPRTKSRIPTLGSQHTVTPGAEEIPARPESALNPLRSRRQTAEALPPAGQISPVDPEQYPPQMSPVLPAQARSTKAPTARSRAETPTHASKTARSHHSHARAHSQPPAPAPSQHLDSPLRNIGTGTDHAAKELSIVSDNLALEANPGTPLHHSAPAPSVAPTSATNVKKIVKESSFHDDTLCELLEAARLNLIGPEAKKALQRAARARVIELKDIREKGTITSALPHIKESEHTGGRSTGHKSSQKSALHEPVPAPRSVRGNTDNMPFWAQQLSNKIADIDSRLAAINLQQSQSMLYSPDEVRSRPMQDSQSVDIPVQLLNDLMFGGLPPALFTSGIPHHTISPMSQDSPQGAHLQMATPGKKVREHSAGHTMSWGSEVELPTADTASPPKVYPGPPTVMVQPPTESNARTRLASIPSRTDPRTPMRIELDLVEEMIIPGTGMADMMDKSLPTTPGEKGSARSKSAAPTPEVGRSLPSPQSYVSPKDVNKATSDASTPILNQVQPKAPTVNGTGTLNDHTAHPSHHQTEPSALTMDAVTARTHATGHTGHPLQRYPGEKQHPKDIIHVKEASEESIELGPWDHVQQKLYTWALVWEEETFVKTLENIALGRQVDGMALTIFAMMTYRRLLNKNLNSAPMKPCDKLLVPTIIAEAVNKAVHNKQYDNAKQILEELWYSLGFKAPPRIVIAIVKHRNESDKWTAHRFDLSNGHLTSYGVTSDVENLPDGRPFMWWHAIRAAWPEYNIPDPDSLKQRMEWIITPSMERNNNSLKALNYARNLLLGFRPELDRDLGKLRETVWEEVKRLMNKKKHGHLVLHVDSQHGDI